ncbi:uncharacterized protein LOC128994790 [Macrosteles quadrilineatus]|uniref:uncharacterized protein LOC128994790 n=1 Tax=Macrosteles quadrilineatus TaxID=74068 RepID=UPI0023E3240A|nr:uncharacterized protein LOC128994790 [Macrosteles quadrilineatus]XP_054275534.1 uncharacterized protein LOC128994790 [Macrosteles quadrilineatus]XP_054275535.1 uncharacterized protein LOC128994790 [Macrosteles quadrilineatus]
MDPSKLAGLPWGVWEDYLEKRKEQMSMLDSKINKLHKEDKDMFGIVVDAEPLNLIVCDKCNMVLKPAALLRHYFIRHSNIMNENSSPDKFSPQLDLKDAEKVVSMNNNISTIPDIDSISKLDLNENMKKCKLSMIQKPSKRLKTFEPKRVLFGELSPNRLKKDVNSKPKGKKDEMSLSTMETYEEKPDINDVDYLLKKLPGMSLKTEGKEINENSNDSVPTTSPPRPLCDAPLFICYKSGGLWYSGRQMKRTREVFQQMLDEENNITPVLIQQLKARKRNIFNGKK